jgi:hypothetical protein
MTLQRIALGIVAAVASLWLTPALQAGTRVTVSGFGASIVTPDAGIGFWIGGGVPERHVYDRPVPVYRDHHYYGHPYRHGYVRIGPPPVVVQPAPPVVIESAPPVIQNSMVTVWITNSNGS